MRRFVVVGHKAVTSSNFTLNDLCGAAGRLDILCRCVNSAFFLSHDMRRDTELFLVLRGEPDPPRTIRLVGSELKYLNPDERSTGALIKKALENYSGRVEERSTPGIYISKRGFEEVIGELASKGKLVRLDEAGEDIAAAGLDGELIFVLGDHIDLDDEEKKILEDNDAALVSLGPESLHSDHCITLVHNTLDRR